MAATTFSECLCDQVETIFGKLPDKLRVELQTAIDRLLKDVVDNVDVFINEQLIPHVAEFIENVYRAPAEKLLESIKIEIIQLLKIYLEKNEISGYDLERTKLNIASLITQTCIDAFMQHAEENNKDMIARIGKCLTHAKFSLSEFAHLVIHDVALPEMRDRLLKSIDQVIDHGGSPEEVLLVLDQNVQVNVMKSVRSFVEDALENLKSRAKKTLKRAGCKAFDRVSTMEEKVRKMSKDKALDTYKFGELLFELLHSIWGDLKSEVICELNNIVRDCWEQATKVGKSSITDYLIPSLTDVIKTNLGVSPEKPLKALEPFFIELLETSMKTGRLPGKDEMVKKAQRYLPELITEMAMPSGAAEQTKRSVTTVLRETASAAIDSGVTTTMLQDTVVPVIASEIIAPNAPDSTKKSIQQIITTVEYFIFAGGQKPSIEGKLVDEIGHSCFLAVQEKLLLNIDDWVENMPQEVDEVMKFVARHVLPVLAAYFPNETFTILAFVFQASYHISQGGTLRGREFIKPVVTKLLTSVTKSCIAKGTESVMGLAKTWIANTGVKTAATNTVASTSKNVTGRTIGAMVGKRVFKKAGKKVFIKTSKLVLIKVGRKMVGTTVKKGSRKVTEKVISRTVEVTGTTVVKIGLKATTKISQETSKKASKELGKRAMKAMSKGAAKKMSRELGRAAIKKQGKKLAVDGLKVSTKRASNSFVKNGSRASRKALEEGTESAVKVGGKAIARAGLLAGITSAAVGGIFLYMDVKALDKAFKNGEIEEKEYRKQRIARFGEFGFEVVASGIAGAAVAAAALSGPAGWAAIAAATVASSVSGFIGNKVVSWIVSREDSTKELKTDEEKIADVSRQETPKESNLDTHAENEIIHIDFHHNSVLFRKVQVITQSA